jgi:hypothetical protein
MEFLIIATTAGYALQLDGHLNHEFNSEGKLREYLREKGVPKRKIDVALKVVNTHSGPDREFRLFA